MTRKGNVIQSRTVSQLNPLSKFPGSGQAPDCWGFSCLSSSENTSFTLKCAVHEPPPPDRYDANTTRYDTRCQFNVRSKADISQLKRTARNQQTKSGKKKDYKVKQQNIPFKSKVEISQHDCAPGCGSLRRSPNSIQSAAEEKEKKTVPTMPDFPAPSSSKLSHVRRSAHSPLR